MNLRKRVRAGDHDAFGELFDAYARSVYNHAFRLTGEWATAEDVVSLTYLDAWRLRGKVDEEGGSLRPWLLGIATNVTRNIRRAARRHAAAVARLPPNEVVDDFADELTGRLDDSAQLARVHTALAKLRRAEREVLALCVWSGLEYAAAAEALGIPVGTVRSRLSRARTKLAKCVEDAEPHPNPGQMRGDRGRAVRPLREGNR
ncbi:RNA polymerase sigma factor [Streptomyces rhizosphaericus]|uniref:RNA polymerase sigma factor n=1 Tax=Streptomyces rhizosphaericus TaxID=114699 RepID=A0A6G4AHK6_9ACTN|nr:RNA polymerase sigma factor [Streptomyces rhizosphaericus]NEW72926.1 RNA polymerase sigma factor [Streptomyces rhizosphaericus]